MAIRQVLLLGNPQLYIASAPVSPADREIIKTTVADLHDTLIDFRMKYGAGRAIAAPQIGVMKRIIYMLIDGVSTVFINPVLEGKSEETFEVWDDCMCFPDMLVKVMRHASCRIRYKNREWAEEVLPLQGDLSELLQHEYDHLEGILAVSRAIDGKSFALKSQKHLIEESV